MDPYAFEARDFALSDDGIHLLRSRYNYRTIEYEKVTKAKIKRDIEISNVIVTLTLGIILTAFIFIPIKYIIELLVTPHSRVVYIDVILLPLLPSAVGIYLVYLATKKGPVLLIETEGKKQKLRMEDFIKTEKLPDVINYLSQKLSYKLIIEDVKST